MAEKHISSPLVIGNTMTSLATARVMIRILLASLLDLVLQGYCSLSASCITGLNVTSVTGSLLRVTRLAVVRASPIVRASPVWLSCVRLLTVGQTSPGWLLPG